MMGTVPGLNQQPESCKYKDMIILFVAEECPGIQNISKLRICGHQLDAPIPSCSEPRSCFCKHSWTLASWESFSCNLRRSFSSSSWWASNSSLRFCLDTDPPQPMAKKQPGSPRHNHEIQKTWALQNVPRGFCLACDPNISKSGSIFRFIRSNPFQFQLHALFVAIGDCCELQSRKTLSAQHWIFFGAPQFAVRFGVKAVKVLKAHPTPGWLRFGGLVFHQAQKQPAARQGRCWFDPRSPRYSRDFLAESPEMKVFATWDSEGSWTEWKLYKTTVWNMHIPCSSCFRLKTQDVPDFSCRSHGVAVPI